MFIFRHGGRRATQVFPQRVSGAKRSYASRIDLPFTPPPVPVVEACPVPTCQCRETPAGLDIEREQNINGSMAAYAEQVLISTGRNDWTSRIENEDEAVLVKQLKRFLGPGGKYSDVRVYMTTELFESYTNAGEAISQRYAHKFFVSTNRISGFAKEIVSRTNHNPSISTNRQIWK